MPKQSIPIELGGKTRHLRFTFNSLVAIEEALGRPISEIGNIMSGSVSVKDIRALIWAGLIHEDKELTQEQVGEWLDMSAMVTISGKLAEAFEAAFPDEKDAKNPEGPKAKSA